MHFFAFLSKIVSLPTLVALWFLSLLLKWSGLSDVWISSNPLQQIASIASPWAFSPSPSLFSFYFTTLLQSHTLHCLAPITNSYFLIHPLCFSSASLNLPFDLTDTSSPLTSQFSFYQLPSNFNSLHHWPRSIPFSLLCSGLPLTCPQDYMSM